MNQAQTTPDLAFITMQQIAVEVSEAYRIPLPQIVRHGKLTKPLMEARRQIIRRIHAKGSFRRSDIARYFGLSIYTITSSLEDDVKLRPSPFTPDEDARISEMHCAGWSADRIHAHLPDRSVAAIRRRLSVLKKSESRFRNFPQPTYNAPGAPKGMVEMAKIENARMLKTL